MKTNSPHKPLHRQSQSGSTLIEAVIALAILLIVSAGVMSVAVVGTTTTENQGNLGARTAEYAQDKIEQLISLAYTDAVSDTTQFPAATSGGTGLTVGGGPDPAAPVTGYKDYLDANGNPLALGAGGAAPSGWYYIRVWQIAQFATNVKQITVTCKVAFGVGASGIGALAQSTVITLKSNPF